MLKQINIVALILAGGEGTRLGNLTKVTNKCMLRFKGNPLIEFSLNNAVAMNVKKIIIVVGHFSDQIITKYGKIYKGVDIDYVHQPSQKGVIDAIECAAHKIKSDDFILMFGDEYFEKPSHNKMYKEFKTKKLYCLCGVVEVNNKSLIEKTYTIKIDNNNLITKLIEKPKKPFNNLMGTGNIIFNNSSLDNLNKVPLNKIRGQKELPDFLQSIIQSGGNSSFFKISNKYFNVNTADEISSFNIKL